jgi:hypothetical protein
VSARRLLAREVDELADDADGGVAKGAVTRDRGFALSIRGIFGALICARSGSVGGGRWPATRERERVRVSE